MSDETDHDARSTTFPESIRSAHRHSSDHRAELLASENCGCFYCQEIYPPSAIIEWIDEDSAGLGQTALCARCGVDSVIGDRSGFPVTKEFLSQMNRYWF